MNRRGPSGGVRPVRGSVSQPMPPAAGPSPSQPARPKIRSKLSLASPIPYGDRAGERQFPPFTPTNSPTTPRLVGRPPRRFEQAWSASETPGRMISAGFAGGH